MEIFGYKFTEVSVLAVIWRKHFIVFKCEQKIANVLVCFTSKSHFKRALLIIAWCFSVLFSQYCVHGESWLEWTGISEGNVLLWCLYGIFMIQKLFPSLLFCGSILHNAFCADCIFWKAFWCFSFCEWS